MPDCPPPREAGRFQTIAPAEIAVSLSVETAGGVPFLVYGGDDFYRFFGWYYGYATCCVEQFCLRAHAFFDGAELPPRELHPVSGHVLCDRCAAGSPAPLRDRPANRYGVIVPARYESDDGPLVHGPQTGWETPA